MPLPPTSPHRSLANFSDKYAQADTTNVSDGGGGWEERLGRDVDAGGLFNDLWGVLAMIKMCLAAVLESNVSRSQPDRSFCLVMSPKYAFREIGAHHRMLDCLLHH